MKLVHPFSGVAAIYFPVGKLKDGGTCEFASEMCLRNCGAFKNATSTNKIGYECKQNTFLEITRAYNHNNIFRIATEVREMKSKVLYWFASGDCPSKFTDKIAQIIKGLSYVIPAQLGFTRNEQLWEKVNKLDNVRIALTLEKPYQSRIQYMSSYGTVAVPNFKTGIVNLYRCDRSYGGCGASIVNLKKFGETIKKKADCSNCYKEKIGCFQDFDIENK